MQRIRPIAIPQHRLLMQTPQGQALTASTVLRRRLPVVPAVLVVLEDLLRMDLRRKGQEDEI